MKISTKYLWLLVFKQFLWKLRKIDNDYLASFNCALLLKEKCDKDIVGQVRLVFDVSVKSVP